MICPKTPLGNRGDAEGDKGWQREIGMGAVEVWAAVAYGTLDRDCLASRANALVLSELFLVRTLGLLAKTRDLFTPFVDGLAFSEDGLTSTERIVGSSEAFLAFSGSGLASTQRLLQPGAGTTKGKHGVRGRRQSSRKEMGVGPVEHGAEFA